MIRTESFPGEEDGYLTKEGRVAELTKRMHEEVAGLGGDPRFVWLQGRVSYLRRERILHP